MSARFAIIPAWAVDDDRLTPAPLRLLLALGSYADAKTGWCHVKRKTLADRLGLSPSTISGHLRTLEDLGYVETKPQTYAHGGKRENEYRVLFDRPPGDVGSADEGRRVQSRGGTSALDPRGDVGSRAEVHEERPLVNVPMNALPLEAGEAAPQPPAEDPARAILAAWWERQDPRPSQPYVACLGVVRRALAAGNSPADVAWALEQVPVVSGGAIDMALRRRRNGTGPGRETPGEIARRMIASGSLR